MEVLREGDGLALLEACEGAFPAHSRAHVAALSLRSKLEGPLEEGLAARNAMGAAVRKTAQLTSAPLQLTSGAPLN